MGAGDDWLIRGSLLVTVSKLVEVVIMLFCLFGLLLNISEGNWGTVRWTQRSCHTIGAGESGSRGELY